MRLRGYLNESIKNQPIQTGTKIYHVYKGTQAIREYIIREMSPDEKRITKTDSELIWDPVNGNKRYAKVLNRDQLTKKDSTINPAFFKREDWFSDEQEALKYAESQYKKHGSSLEGKKGKKKKLKPIQAKKRAPKKTKKDGSTNEPLYTFTHYGSGKKGILGLWGAEDASIYKHFEKKGKKIEINYDKNDKILFVDSYGFDPVPGEALFKKVIRQYPEYAEDSEHFLDLDEHELWMDIIGAIHAKSRGYDAIIFNTESGMQTIDLRKHTVKELKKNYELAKQGKIGYYF